MSVVTISGQTGSGAHAVGRLAAEHLHLDYIDQEILVAAAQELGVPIESVVSHDERTTGLGERLASMLRRFLEHSAAAGAADPMLGGGGLDVLLGRTYTEAAAEEGLQEVSDELYVKTLCTIVSDLATHDNVLIIGRGSQAILADRSAAVHVLLVAPLEHRVEVVADREELDAEAAAKRVHDSDKGRAAFHRKFFNINVDDPSLYHLVLNTARFPLEEAAHVISEVLGRAGGQGAQP